MNDMTTMTTACANCPHRKPLALLPAQRVDAPSPDMQAKAREGRLLALAAKAARRAARRAAAFQPVEVVLIDPDFRARVEAIAARRVVTATARPLAAG